MAEFSTLGELLNTTDGMEVLRNNSGQDDGVDTVTGVDWFTFNGVVASEIYVSGNSFVGFGSTSEHLKICRRDGKMWYLYRQEGTIGNTEFLKIRWQGYTVWNSTSSSYALNWELFLFSDGGIYLNIGTVPSDSSYLGTNQLLCGSNTYSFSVAASTPVGYSFIPDGSGQYTLLEGEYPVYAEYISSGSIEFSSSLLRGLGILINSEITWKETTPEGTSLSVYAKTSSGEYTLCQTGSPLPVLLPGRDYSEETLYLRVNMDTANPSSTPALSNLCIKLYSQGDDHKVALSFAPGNTTSIQNAVGAVRCSYAGGTLRSAGGAVAPFDTEFTPGGLTPKNNPNIVEHMEITGITAQGTLTEVFYSSYQSSAEHMEITGITAQGTLTEVTEV